MANRYAIREQTQGRFQARWYDDGGKRRSKMNRPGSSGDFVQATSRIEAAVGRCSR